MNVMGKVNLISFRIIYSRHTKLEKVPWFGANNDSN